MDNKTIKKSFEILKETAENYISIEDKFYPVKMYSGSKNLKSGTAYVCEKDWGDYVKIFRGKFIDGESYLPGLYSKDSGLVEIKCPSEKEHEKYHISHIIDLKMNSVIKKITSDPKDTVDMIDQIQMSNANSTVYAPSIKPNDDLLKRAIKTALANKQVNMKNYKDFFENNYDLNNMKAVLTKDGTAMSTKNFYRWIEILGLDFELVLKDNGTDKISPMNEDVIVDSQEIQKEVIK